MTRPTVLVADDHALIAEALSSSLGRWYQVVGIVTGLDGLESGISRTSPQIVLLDLAFGKVSALEALPRLVARYAETRFVILTAHADPVLADAALRAGAVAYIVKESAPAELRIAIDEALAGRTYVTPMMQRRGAGGGAFPDAASPIHLSERQRSVLARLRSGHSYANIAAEFDISTKTVEYHVATLTRRLGIHGKAQLIRWAERQFRDEQE